MRETVKKAIEDYLTEHEGPLEMYITQYRDGSNDTSSYEIDQLVEFVKHVDNNRNTTPDLNLDEGWETLDPKEATKIRFTATDYFKEGDRLLILRHSLILDRLVWDDLTISSVEDHNIVSETGVTYWLHDLAEYKHILRYRENKKLLPEPNLQIDRVLDVVTSFGNRLVLVSDGENYITPGGNITYTVSDITGFISWKSKVDYDTILND